MRALRKLWLVAGAVVLAALLFLGGVEYLNRRSAAQDAARAAVLLDHMFDLLEDDPHARDAATRQAVEAVARLAEYGAYRTAETAYGLGILREGQGDLDGAEQAYREAIALSPSWSRPYTGLGIVLQGQGRTDEAEQAFRKAIELDPDWSRPHNDLAVLLRQEGRLEEAEQHARTALDLDPASAATHNNYGNLLVAMDRFDEAEAAYRKAMELDSAHAAPVYNLACLYALEDRREAALATLRQALKLEPGFVEAARKDTDFEALRNTQAFKRLLREFGG